MVRISRKLAFVNKYFFKFTEFNRKILLRCEENKLVNQKNKVIENEYLIFYNCDFPVWDDSFYDNNIEIMVSSLESSRKEVEKLFANANEYYNLRRQSKLPLANADLISMYYYTRIYVYHNIVLDLRKYILPRYEKAFQNFKDKEL